MHLYISKESLRQYVFPNKNGKPFQDIKRAFKTTVRKADIEKNISLHTLRHTWVSQMVMAGVPLEVLQKLGGWKSYTMVLRYAHISPSYQKSWVDHFESQIAVLWLPKGKEQNTEVSLSLDTVGAHDRTRTGDPRITNALLCR